MTYKINLIPPNLRKNETIIQIADSLDQLSRVMNDIMFHIEKRVDVYNDKLKDVSNRVDEVERKIFQIRGVKNAIQVFSSSKYPANDTGRNYISIFPINSDIPLRRHEVTQKYPLKKDEPIDKLHIYHVKLSKVETEKIGGLGHVPNDVNCVSDLTLYNSGKNPYKEFSILKSVQILQPSAKIENNEKNIGTAPASISERLSFQNLPNQEYFYSPDLGDVPSLDVPLDLPDLPGIAGNVRYQEDNNWGIAPSVSFTAVTKNNLEDQKILGYDRLPELTSLLPLPVAEKDELPESFEKIVVKEEIKSIQPEIMKKEEEIVENVVEEKKNDKPLSKLPIVPDSRASLMEAIREAGGKKKLKSIDETKTSKQTESSGGDLMADLHLKLAMRRKGISGAKKNIDNSELDSRGTLSLMSALIPPPEETNEETDQEDDWE